jgi:hypothetical protein
MSSTPTIVRNFEAPLYDDRLKDVIVGTVEGQMLHCQVELNRDGNYKAFFVHSYNVNKHTNFIADANFDNLMLTLSNFTTCNGCEVHLKPGNQELCVRCDELNDYVYVIPAGSHTDCVICMEAPVVIAKLCPTCKHQVCRKCMVQYHKQETCPHCKVNYPLKLKRKFVDSESDDDDF